MSEKGIHERTQAPSLGLAANQNERTADSSLERLAAGGVWPGARRHGETRPMGDSALGRAHYRQLGIERTNIVELHISLRKADAIRSLVKSVLDIQASEEGTLLLRLDEIRRIEEWSGAEWNAFAIVARVMLADHFSYNEVMTVVQEKGGY